MENILVFRKKNNPEKAKFFKPNKRIVYRLYEDDKKQRGRLGEMEDSTLYIDGVAHQLSDFKMIGGRSAGLVTAKVIGGTVFATGSIISAMGAYWIVVGLNNDDSCEGVILVLLGAGVATIGTAAVLVGAIPLAITGKRYRLDTKWDVEIGEREIKQKRKKE